MAKIYWDGKQWLEIVSESTDGNACTTAKLTRSPEVGDVVKHWFCHQNKPGPLPKGLGFFTYKACWSCYDTSKVVPVNEGSR